MDFSGSWWIVIGIVYVPYVLLAIHRKSYEKQKELRAQLVMGVVTLLFSFVVEFVAVSNNLWNYVPNNWPVILWFMYFGSGLLGYQLAKMVEAVGT